MKNNLAKGLIIMLQDTKLNHLKGCTYPKENWMSVCTLRDLKVYG